MTIVNEVYKCEACGNIVEILHTGAGALVCCGSSMKKFDTNTVDAAIEKHVPVVRKKDTTLEVVVGEVDHPMEEAHYIEWIEILADNKVYRQDLKPGDTPKAVFNIESDNYEVRAYCNLHGLWKAN